MALYQSGWRRCPRPQKVPCECFLGGCVEGGWPPYRASPYNLPDGTYAPGALARPQIIARAGKHVAANNPSPPPALTPLPPFVVLCPTIRCPPSPRLRRRKDYCSSPTECSSRNQGPCEGSGSFPSLAGFPLGPGLPHGPVDMLLAPPGPGEGHSAPPSLVRGPGADAHTLYNPLIDGSFLLPSGMLPHPGSADFLHLSGGQDGPGAWN